MSTAIFPTVNANSLPLVELVRQVSKNIGIAQSDIVVSSSDRNMVEMLQFANETGRELLRRVDWGQLYTTTDLIGTGEDSAFAMPDDFDRMGLGIAGTYDGRVLRALTRHEWASLVSTEGAPRYFLIENNQVRLWPYLESGDSATIGYISSDWATQGDGFQADTDSTVFDSDLFVKGLIVRWRRQKGMDYADFEAEYEALLADRAKFNERTRF